MSSKGMRNDLPSENATSSTREPSEDDGLGLRLPGTVLGLVVTPAFADRPS